jgi:inorganic triphosphatase YgiF
VIDRYLDTAAGDGALRAAGLRARLRISPSGVVLAVKGRASVADGGVSTRMELEAPATADLHPARWPPSPGRALVTETIGGAPLVEIAAVRQGRRVRNVRRGDAVVELSLDRLTALGAGGEELATRLELEAELKAGPPEALEELAGALTNVDGLAPPLGSKLEFALAARMAARPER